MPVKVGVAWRRDARGKGHEGDLDALRVLRDIDLYSVVWSGAPDTGTLRTAGIEEIDVLVVPGGPHANDTQVSLTQKTAKNAAPDKDAAYASARAASELDLIERARYLGMPVLAICGGSWRLLENYKGKTVELGSLTEDGKLGNGAQENRELASRHAGDMRRVASEFKHPATIQPGTMLHGALTAPGKPSQGEIGKASVRRGNAATTPVSTEVNSVHWAAAYEGAKMRPSPDAKIPYRGIDPNNLLTVNARDSGAAGTVEGFESVSGAPLVGLQWHPEYMTPGGAGGTETDLQKASRKVNLAAMQYVIDAGSAYRLRRNLVKDIQQNIREMAGAFPKSAVSGNFDSPVTPIAAVQVPSKKPGDPPKPQTFPKPPLLPGEAKLPAQRDMALGEYLVRHYLGALGGKRWQLKKDEWENLLEGKPLSAVREGDGPGFKMLGERIAKDVWLARFIGAGDLQSAKRATTAVRDPTNPWVKTKGQ